MKRGNIDTLKGMQWLRLMLLGTKSCRWFCMMTNKLYSIKTVITETTGIKSIHILQLKLNFEVFQKKIHPILTNKDSIIQVREVAH